MAFVEDLYQKYLKREGDPEGIAHWKNDLAQGVSKEDVENSFKTSVAYYEEQDTNALAKKKTDDAAAKAITDAATAATAAANKTSTTASVADVTKAVAIDKVFGSSPNAIAGSSYAASNYAPTTLSEQMNTLLAENSDYLKMARTQSDQNMNSRGLMNTSIAQGASQAAAIDRAMPIAQGDVAALNQASRDNATFDNSAAIFKANTENTFALENKRALDNASANYAAAQNNASIQNASNGIRVVLQDSMNEINAYNNELVRQTNLDKLSYDIFTSAVNSGIYSDTSVYDPETGAMTKDNSEFDQARINGFWQQISEIIPDAGRPVINEAIEGASEDVVQMSSFRFNPTPTASQFDSTPASRSSVQIPDINLGDVAKNMVVNKAKDFAYKEGRKAVVDYGKNAPAGSWANNSFNYVSDGISAVGSAIRPITNALGLTTFRTGAYLSTTAAANLATNTAANTAANTVAPAAAGSFSVSGNAAAAVIAFLGQKYLGGEAGTGATVGGTIGGMVSLGNPMGIAIGATIGAAIGSLFGGGKKSNKWQIARVGLNDHQGVYDHGYGYDASQPDKRFRKFSQSNADSAVGITNYLGGLTKNLESLTGTKLTDTLFVKVGSRSGTHLIKNGEWQAHSKDGESFIRQSVDIVVDMYNGSAVVDELAAKYGITRESAGDKYNMYVLGTYQMEQDAIQKEADRQDTMVENKQYQISQDMQRQEEVAAGTRRGMPTRPGTNSFTAAAGEVRTRQMPQRPQGLLGNAREFGKSAVNAVSSRNWENTPDVVNVEGREAVVDYAKNDPAGSWANN